GQLLGFLCPKDAKISRTDPQGFEIILLSITQPYIKIDPKLGSSRDCPANFFKTTRGKILKVKT
ncbi:MAG: hypothetical protein ACP5CD_07495, partial [Thermovirgaceae bacterium]